MSKLLKKSIAFILAVIIFMQSADFSFMVYGSDKANVQYIWTNETTEEILEMMQEGLDLSTFFEGDLVEGTTKEDLLNWKMQGKDINDIVNERAREKSSIVTYENLPINTGKVINSENNIESYQRKKYLASADPDGKYYLTDCFIPENKGTVDLRGTEYADALFNPKTGGSGTSTPWHITLGGDEAMCVSFEGSASKTSKAHHYIQADINNLKNNPYFRGGSDYPVEAYLKGACYAYERLLGALKRKDYTFYISEGTLDSNYKELERLVGATLLGYAGREVNHAVLQILTWRIAQGSFNPNNLEYEHNVASIVFRQMYDEDSGFGITYADKITAFYDFYALCAKEAASGKYNQKYRTVQIKYWEVQGSNTVNWQDFITWDAGTDVPKKDNFTITKYGKVISNVYKYPNARFYIYSDSNCTNKIGEFTTDNEGAAKINIVEGIYYLKEVEAPTGTLKNDKSITLTVDDSTISSSITNDEIYNGIYFQKTSSVNGDIVPQSGKYALYEYISGKDTYMKLCEFSFLKSGFTNSKGVNIPDYSYILTSGTKFTYHNNDGTIAKTVTGSSFYFTPVNKGKFKIVEEEAPDGYIKNTDDYEFEMDLSEQGKLISISKGKIKDGSYKAGVKIAKYDALSEQKLDRVSFKIQEQINEKWYDVGNLVYDDKEQLYKTSATETYLVHNNTGAIVDQMKNTDYPLFCSTANNGIYRIVETVKQNENYVDTYVKNLLVKPKEHKYIYEYIDYGNGIGDSAAVNTGKSISVKIAKYDSITEEMLVSSDICTLTVYEYNHIADKWQEVGDLIYNADTGLYETDMNAAYTPHKEDGTLSAALLGRVYDKGMLYYTSVNEGDYKIVETVNPTNYLSGKIDKNMEIETFEKIFSLNGLMDDKMVIDMTDAESAAHDTGIYLNVELSKFDGITKEKITDSQAVFTVYENINGKWMEMGKLKYDSASHIYKTAGNIENYIYHNSSGKIVNTGSILAGLHYTTANKGKFKVVETLPPEYYLVGSKRFEKEFDFNDAEDGIVKLTDISSAAVDIGIKGTISVKKYDAATLEDVKSTNMIATVYEKIGENWYEMGNLKFDVKTKAYGSEGVKFLYHNSKGEVLETLNIKDFEEGKLYYTTANKGRFKIVENAAPSFYTLIHPEIPTKYTKEFTLVSDNQKFEFYDETEAIKNFGITVTIDVNKYDIITKDETPSKDAIFVVQEYLVDKKVWVDVVTLAYDYDKGIYTTTGQTVTLHKADQTAGYINSEGKLYYTTQNLGKYKILEKSAPSYYSNGSTPYEKEFNITSDALGNKIDFSKIENSAQNLGIYETVSVVKYDRITSEEVETKDAVFTVYEKINDRWMEVGNLKYNNISEMYTCDEVKFIFHNNDGTVADTDGIPDYYAGRLYYTSANKGQFKIKEKTPPTNYTNEVLFGESDDIFEREFTIDVNGETNDYNNISSAAKNVGVYTYLNLLKYDHITKKNIEFKDAIFTVEEYVNGEWIPVADLRYDKESGVYTSKDVEVTLHNSKGENVYSSADGKLYYTTANKGRYRVREAKAPTNYVLERFVNEFNILDSNNQLIDLTEQVNAPNDLGIYSTVETVKYDLITDNPVKTNDTEFTVYENISGKWYESGKLVYDKMTGKYVSTDVNFKFHDENGNVLTTEEIDEFKKGRLYYTTANRGKFKVVETNAPQYYTKGTFSKEFIINKNGYVFSYVTSKTGALNKGISIPVKVQKYDVLTKRVCQFKDTIFEVQEYIESIDTWLKVGNLSYDESSGCYTTKDMNITYHSENGEEVLNITESALTYTSANLGEFRVLEVSPPTNYTESTKQYIYQFNITKDSVKGSDNQEMIDITDITKASKNLGIPGALKVAKFDSITEEKVLAGNAEFTIYEYIENIDKWIKTGILVYDDIHQEYVCDGVDFVFHDENGKSIITADIPDFETGCLYYTTANKGKFKVVETNAPDNYRIDGFEREFNISEEIEVMFNDIYNAAYDTGIRSTIELVKADSLTNEKLAGATFEVQEWSQTSQTWLDVGTLIDRGDGTYTTDGMKVNLHTGKSADTVDVEKLIYTTQNLGKYRIVETEAPVGYINDLYVSDILTADTDLQIIELTSDDLKALDTPIRVGISKMSLTGGKMIKGATLTVKDMEGNIVDTWITDGTEHIISAIPEGKYILIEERAAKGYIAAESIEFEVTKSLDIQKVVMVDDEVKGQVVINKTDRTTGTKLAGAKFEIKDEDGNVIETLITDYNGFAESKLISFGIYDEDGVYKGSKKYTISEVSAPNGYELDREEIEIMFEYKDDKTPVIIKNLELKNDKTPVIVNTGDKVNIVVIMSALFAIITFIAMFAMLENKED